MILYTCGQKKRGPGAVHPCAKAAKALDAAGYQYELRTAGSYRLMPWTWGHREEDRAEVRKLSGGRMMDASAGEGSLSERYRAAIASA